MIQLDNHPSGRHFLQIPGPSPVPDRILRAISLPTIDHRGPEFGVLGLEVLEGLKHVFQTEGHVVIYPASGTGAWEAALVNALSPGDRVLMFETGHFATLWNKMATKLGLQPEFVATDWRRGADPAIVEAKLKEDKAHAIKAVCVVHNETSTGVVSRIGEVRKAIDRARHPALLLVADKIDRDAFGNCVRKLEGIPVGETNAAVRLGLADVLRLRGAVDAVAIAEIDPHAADRIVGAGGDLKLLF